MSNEQGCWTCEDYVTDLMGCPVGDPDEFDDAELACGRSYDRPKIKDAVEFALSWAQATLPRSFETIEEVTVTKAGCYQQFTEFEDVYSILAINGKKIDEEEAEDEDKSWGILDQCATVKCENPVLKDKAKNNFSIMKSNLVEFRQELEVGDVLLACVRPCLDPNGCLPNSFKKPGPNYAIMRLMSMYFLFCNIGNTDAEERQLADKYLNLASNLVTLHYQLKRSQFEESLKYLDRTDA